MTHTSFIDFVMLALLFGLGFTMNYWYFRQRVRNNNLEPFKKQHEHRWQPVCASYSVGGQVDLVHQCKTCGQFWTQSIVSNCSSLYVQELTKRLNKLCEEKSNEEIEKQISELIATKTTTNKQ